MPVLMTRELSDTPCSSEEGEKSSGDYSCILWTGGSRKVPIVMFHAEAILSKELSLRMVGERYHMSYKMVRTDSRLVRSIFSAHGFQEVHANSSDFNLMWTGSHVKPHLMRNLSSFQRVNHFPRSYELTRKDRLYKNVQRMQQTHGFRNFHLLPQTYLLPAEYQDFCNAFSKDRGPWIVKPVASSRGRGVYLINSPSQISMEDNILVSRYISNPLLIDGFKFDVRLYVLITSYDPLVIYLYEEGLTRFATVKYDRGTKNIRNQFMHLTNYSVNKRSGDYVSCDDPEVEDYGNKWSMSAMLRYLKQDGTDTAALMSQVEDLIIKTVISGEFSIATACKSFLVHRSNCFELYGFDVLIDGNLKPWLLEVNLSPSLACDAPLDLKVKASMISDMLTLIGLECQDPQQRVGRGGTTLSDHKRTQKPPRPVSGHCQPANSKLCQRPLSASDVDTELQGGSREKCVRRGSCTLGLSIEEIKTLRRVQEEADRRGGFIRVFPRADTWELYGSLLEFKTSLNYMLATNLFPDRSCRGAGGGGGRSRPQLTGSCDTASDTKRHAALYERKLLSLELRRRRRCGVTRRTGPSHVSERPVHEEGGSEQEEEDAAENEELDQVPPSLDSSQPPHTQGRQPPHTNLMGVLQKDVNLSKLQARLAFSCYLQRVQRRLHSDTVETLAPKEDEQMELVMRFLQRAACNLQQSVCVSLPGQSVPFLQRRHLLAKQLGEFIHSYNQETEHMLQTREVSSDNGAHGVNPHDFQAFVAGASECELEEVLTLYTRKNKCASVFLGTPNSRTSKAVREGLGAGSQGPGGPHDCVTHERSSTVLSTSAHLQSAGRPQGLPSSVVSLVSEPCAPGADTSLQLPHNLSSPSPGESRAYISSYVGQTIIPGGWSQTALRDATPRSQPSSLSPGVISSFQSATQIYSQRLNRPSSTRAAGSQQNSLRSRSGSAGGGREPEDLYNRSAVTSALQRLAEKQARRQQSSSSSQLRLLTQQLTRMNMVSGALSRSGLHTGTDPQALVTTMGAPVRTIHSDTEVLETERPEPGARDAPYARCAWDGDMESNAYSVVTGVPPQHRYQPTAGSSQLHCTLQHLQHQRAQTRTVLEQSRARLQQTVLSRPPSGSAVVPASCALHTGPHLLTSGYSQLLPTPPANQKHGVVRKLSASRIARVGASDGRQTPGSYSSEAGAPSLGSMETAQVIFARSRPPVPPPRTTSRGQRKREGQIGPE